MYIQIHLIFLELNGHKIQNQNHFNIQKLKKKYMQNQTSQLLNIFA